MEQVLVPVLVMIGATLLVMLAIPLGFLAVSGFYFARRTATWLVPLIRQSASDTRSAAVDLGRRVVHRLVNSRLPQALVTGAVGCAFALPAFAGPVRDMAPGWGRYPEQHTGQMTGGNSESAAQIGACCGGPQARPSQEQGANQVRSGPAPTTGSLSRSVAPVDQCTGNCGSQRDQSGSKSKDKGKSKSKDKSSKSKSKSKA